MNVDPLLPPSDCILQKEYELPQMLLDILAFIVYDFDYLVFEQLWEHLVHLIGNCHYHIYLYHVLEKLLVFGTSPTSEEELICDLVIVGKLANS